jgi:hypothetical protein
MSSRLNAIPGDNAQHIAVTQIGFHPLNDKCVHHAWAGISVRNLVEVKQKIKIMLFHG